MVGMKLATCKNEPAAGLASELHHHCTTSCVAFALRCLDLAPTMVQKAGSCKELRGERLLAFVLLRINSKQ
jgi:hypothetical protein